MKRSKAGLYLGIYLTIFLCCCKTTELVDDLDRGWGNCYDMMELVEGSRPDRYDEGDFSESFQNHFSEKSQVIANGNTTRQLLGVGASLTQIVLNLTNKSKSYGAVLDHDLNILDELYFEKDEPGKIIPPSV